MALAIKHDTITQEEKKDVLDKLKRIEGRIRGIANMVEESRDIEDVMMQVSASYEALRVVMKSLVKKHMEQSVSKGLISTNANKRDEAYDNLINDIFKYVR
jgi:CsoR family transcriptional regulator, copper-sensing transcriptional repressor